MNLSVITAAIPSLHRFLNDLQHGALGTRITENQYELSMGNNHGLSDRFGLSKSDSSREDPKSQHSLHHSGSRLSNRIFSDHATKSANRSRPTERTQDRQIPEEKSTSSLTNNGVTQTWEISIEVENKQKKDLDVATATEGVKS